MVFEVMRKAVRGRKEEVFREDEARQELGRSRVGVEGE